MSKPLSPTPTPPATQSLHLDCTISPELQRLLRNRAAREDVTVAVVVQRAIDAYCDPGPLDTAAGILREGCVWDPHEEMLRDVEPVWRSIERREGRDPDGLCGSFGLQWTPADSHGKSTSYTGAQTLAYASHYVRRHVRLPATLTDRATAATFNVSADGVITDAEGSVVYAPRAQEGGR